MKIKLDKVAKVLSGVVIFIVAIVVILSAFMVGFSRGFMLGKSQQQVASATTIPSVLSSPTPTPKTVYVPTKSAGTKITWGGPALWEAVNKRRVQLGVGPLSVKDDICTLSSIRLNELLKLGSLDGHAGFSKLAEREDLKPTFEKYNLSEFLVSGADSPQEAVNLWENTLGHKELLTGGQYVWGCIYAQEGFGVAIAAY
jgi:uncharacterized protein YkwD